ncbi:sugar phosphate nucleotidyltransferase [Taibaiella soli]|uniref:Nucleotidyltransferase n=1 Tax=Taibaiella soli TaxID=1649169 RepID=A0A2W2BBZ7_9BACT|nr:sugar phosphate nucleotidyltransferase [Taibaiella soli]PZF73417.1 nucleotidyltransferase [Taibaiella soli]
MNIIIPMAGMGKRMRPHTLTTAKPLIPIAGKPIVQRLVEDIIATSNEKVEEIAFVIGPSFGKEVEKHLCEVAASLGAKGKICYQETPLGTAHAILCAAESLKGNVFIAFADTLFKATFSIDASKDAIVWTQKVADPSAFGVVKLNGANEIEAFVEKPKEFVSDLAIIGVYYFRDGEFLRQQLQRLIDNNIVQKGEYQITDAMDHMLQNGTKFYTDQVEEWLDCGNKDATVYTNQRILEIKNGKETLQAASAKIENSIIIQPCFIGENVVVRNSVVGPHVSLEAGVEVIDSRIENSMILTDTVVKNVQLENSLLGKNVTYIEKPKQLSLGDFSTQL